MLLIAPDRPVCGRRQGNEIFLIRVGEKYFCMSGRARPSLRDISDSSIGLEMSKFVFTPTK